MTVTASNEKEAGFLTWLTSNGTTLLPNIKIASFDDMGRGLVATADIEPDTLLFSLPRPLLLTTVTSLLPSLLPTEEWAALSGWSPLILILMYERSRPATSGHWSPYFALLPPPESFNTLMFWSEPELLELAGTTVVGKVGREEAEEEWRENVWPLVKKHPEVFRAVEWDGEGELEERYGLAAFHYCGSLILSRSFHVETGDGSGSESGEDSDDEEEEEQKEDVSEVAMVPMADILNAKSGCDNARLFYEPLSLNMMSTSFIPAGTQIFNTYADPPNADLLRRYGHLDEENAADEVEIGLETVVELFVDAGKLSQDEGEARAEWLLEAGLEDTFSLPTSHALPDELVIALRAFLLSQPDFQKIVTKDSPPRPKVDASVAEWALKLLSRRAALYPTSIEDDEALLANGGPDAMEPLAPRHRMALIVRVGEKRILKGTIAGIEKAWPAGCGSAEGAAGAKKATAKRGREEGKPGAGAKRTKGN